jgi:asparagine synthase (glutamine-hydrolysing)
MTVRTPLLDNDIVELMYRALDEVREGEATSLRLVREGNPLLAEKTAPASKNVLGLLHGLLRKQHLGNHSPYLGLWFRNELSGWVREVLLDRRSLERPYLNKSYLEKIVTDHTQGKGNHTDEITAVLTAELVNRIFMDRS